MTKGRPLRRYSVDFLRSGQPRQSPVHFDHGQRIALTVGEKCAPQLKGLPSIRNTARCQLQECCRRCTTIGYAIKVVITEAWTEGWSNGFDRVASIWRTYPAICSRIISSASSSDEMRVCMAELKNVHCVWGRLLRLVQLTVSPRHLNIGQDNAS
jgi:hypothetical protein